jgi:hypothetical protein
MRTRMPSFTIILLVTAAVLLAVGSIVAGAVPGPPSEMPPPPGGEAQHYDLGNGHYVAVIPAASGLADTYNQEPYIDTYVSYLDPTGSYCTSSQFVVGYSYTQEFPDIYRDTSSIANEAAGTIHFHRISDMTI